MKLLLIEDTPALAELTQRALEREGFAVDLASTAADAAAIAAAAPPDVIVLDLGLPDGDGLKLLARWRREGSSAPVLVVTARGGLNDRIDGLDSGADDYLVKPAAPAEIAARCRALLRRPGRLLAAELTLGNLVLDTQQRLATVSGRLLSISPRDVAVLETLLRKAGAVVQRQQIEAAVYRLDESPGPNALEAAISRIRKLLAEADATVRIHTIRGVGYMIEAGDSA